MLPIFFLKKSLKNCTLKTIDIWVISVYENLCTWNISAMHETNILPWSDCSSHTKFATISQYDIYFLREGQKCIPMADLMPTLGQCLKNDHELTFSQKCWGMVSKGLASQHHNANLIPVLEFWPFISLPQDWLANGWKLVR